MQKKSNNVYTMLELETLTFPVSKEQIIDFHSHRDKVANLIHVFERFCKDAGGANKENELCETMYSPLLRSIDKITQITYT